MQYVSATKIVENAKCESVQFLEVERIQDQLDALRARLRGLTQDEPKQELETFDEGHLIAMVIRSRRKRDAIFGRTMFGEPAWDMLLELFVAERLGRKLSVSGLCHSSGVPAGTALRWVDRLEKDGWISREADKKDRRRYWVILTQRGSASMLKYVRSLDVRSL